MERSGIGIASLVWLCNLVFEHVGSLLARVHVTGKTEEVGMQFPTRVRLDGDMTKEDGPVRFTECARPVPILDGRVGREELHKK